MGLVKGGYSELEANSILVCRRPLLQQRWLGSINVLTLVQDVPVLSLVRQKGAYWRRTCSFFFDVPTDEDFDTHNLSCAHLSRNRVLRIGPRS